MHTSTVPASRFGWEGQTVEYVVKADGAAELAAPQDCPSGVQVRVLDQREVDGGLEAHVAVEVGKGALY